VKLFSTAVLFLASAVGIANSDFQCSLASPKPSVLEAASLSGKTPVFVYYANDLAINPGYDWTFRNHLSLLAKIQNARGSSLTKDEKSYLEKVAWLLEEDVKRFHEATAKQANLVETIGCGDKNLFQTGSVVITNHSVKSPVPTISGAKLLKLKFTYCRPKGSVYERGVENIDINLPTGGTADFVASLDHLYSQALLSPLALRDLIEKLNKLYDPTKTQFILWMKGYGDVANVFRPLYEVDSLKVKSEDLWQALLASPVDDIEKADSSALARSVRSFAPQIRSVIEKSFEKAKHVQKASEMISLDKVDVLQANLNLLFGSIRVFTSFPYVIWETDESALESSPNTGLKNTLAKGGTEQMKLSNVGEVCTLKKNPSSYEEVDFEQLFVPLGADIKDGFMKHFANTLK